MAGDRIVSELHALTQADQYLSQPIRFMTPRSFTTGGTDISTSAGLTLGGRKVTVRPDGLSSIQVHSFRQLNPGDRPGLSAFAAEVSGQAAHARLYLIPEDIAKRPGRADISFRVNLPEPITPDQVMSLRLPTALWRPEDFPQDDLFGAILVRSIRATEGGIFPWARFAWLGLQRNKQTPAHIREMLERVIDSGQWTSRA